MKVAIIGGGPSGLFLAKYLSKHANSITIYEKSGTFGGMYNYSYNPKLNIFKNILNTKNIDFKPNFEITESNFKTIEPYYDKFVLAIGGVPNFNENSSYINALDIIKNKVSINSLGKKVCIIGMGNVALDVCRKIITKVNEIDIISRGGLYISKFGNNVMREILNLANFKGHNISLPSNLKENRRYNLLNNNNIKIDKTKNNINLFFDTSIKKVTKINGKYVVEFNNGCEHKYDSIITSFGFKANQLKINTDKPVYKIGWCDIPFGNISDAVQSAKKMVYKILI